MNSRLVVVEGIEPVGADSSELAELAPEVATVKSTLEELDLPVDVHFSHC